MLKLDPKVESTARPLAEGIAIAANEDADPLYAAAELVAVAYYESHFDLYAVSPETDSTRSIGAFQISTQWLRFPASPYHQAKVSLWLMRDSQRMCGSLARYASGRCDRGWEEAHRREMLANRIMFPEYLELRQVTLTKRREERLVEQ